jgi:hypothetical protein
MIPGFKDTVLRETVCMKVRLNKAILHCRSENTVPQVQMEQSHGARGKSTSGNPGIQAVVLFARLAGGAVNAAVDRKCCLSLQGLQKMLGTRDSF